MTNLTQPRRGIQADISHRENSRPKGQGNSRADAYRAAGADPRGSGFAGLVVVNKTSRTRKPSKVRRTSEEWISAMESEKKAFRIDPVMARNARMKRRLVAAAKLFQYERPRDRVVMITPTYRPGEAWAPQDMSELLGCIRKHLARRGIRLRYEWRCELGEQNGRLHFHLLIWLPRKVKLPKPDRQGWWKKGSTRIEAVRNAVGYIIKYATKDAIGSLPKGCRMYDVGGHEGEALLERRWLALPSWLRDVKLGLSRYDRCRRAKGGGWLSRLTGELFRSPFEVFFCNGTLWAVRIDGCV